MALTMRITNTEALRARHDELLHALEAAVGENLSSEDMRMLADSGRFSEAERALYDELRRVELMLYR
ncbi:hypothetical protein QP999_03950 [Corynebacterium sp. MSK004]|uniref:hypothetical protein n=1 Tax=unclassified Corynebacterium TaxID=2624378 RepID=UPI00114D0F5C|nr:MULTISPECIES: hypothetical protein [unclassified Corynebacterium]MDK8897098.1 hypothetical protein [Corynebacterium sp. MSK004]